MKTNRFSIPLSRTAAVVGLIACAVSCAKKNSEPPKPQPALPEPAQTNAVTDNTSPPAVTNGTAAAENAVTVTNVTPAAAPSADITNPPLAETTIKAPESATALETNVPGHATVVEMPATTPAAPTNFYPASITTNSSTCCLKPAGGEGNPDFFLRFRGGYDHIYHGNNNDSYWLSAKFYAYGDGLREQAGKNGWFIPDADAIISSSYLPKPDDSRSPGSDNGLSFRADFTWPWLRWTAFPSGNTNSVCPFCRPLALGLGPTANVGFDHLYDEADYRFARYAGVRLTFNRSGFIEYTAGETDGLDGTRQQIVAEIPFYESTDGEVRYYVRGLWNHGSSDHPDVLEGGLFVEMPFSTIFSPSKWGDLVPFAQ